VLLQAQHRARLAAAVDGLLVPLALEGPRHAVGFVIGYAVNRGHRIDMGGCVAVVDDAAREHHALYRQLPCRLLVVLVKGPVVAARLIAQQPQLRLLEAQHRHHDALAQQRQQFHRERELAHAGEFAASLHRCRLTDVHIARHQVWQWQIIAPGAVGAGPLLAPGQRQWSPDGKRPGDGLADALADPRPRAVPVISCQRDRGGSGGDYAHSRDNKSDTNGAAAEQGRRHG